MARIYRSIIYVFSLFLIVLTALFTVKNTSLGYLQVPFIGEQIALPIYLSHLLFFFGGCAFTWLYFGWSHLRGVMRMRKLRKKVKKLSNESALSTPPRTLPPATISDNGEPPH